MKIIKLGSEPGDIRPIDGISLDAMADSGMQIVDGKGLHGVVCRRSRKIGRDILGGLTKKNRDICFALSLCNGIVRKAAKKINIPHKTLVYKLSQIRENLKKNIGTKYVI